MTVIQKIRNLVQRDGCIPLSAPMQHALQNVIRLFQRFSGCLCPVGVGARAQCEAKIAASKTRTLDL